MKVVYQAKAETIADMDRDQLAALFELRETVAEMDEPITNAWKGKYALVLGKQITERAIANGIDPLLVWKKVL